MKQMKPLLKEPYEEEYTWSYTFNTTLTRSSWWMSSIDFDLNKASIPFYIPPNITLTVNWGDGNIETLNYMHSCFHTYAQREQTYTISVTSKKWSKIWLCGGDPGNVVYHIGGYGTYWYKHSSDIANQKYNDGEWMYDFCSNKSSIEGNIGFGSNGLCTGLISRVAAMRMGCRTISNPLPRVAGVLQCDPIFIDENALTLTYDGVTPEEFFSDVPDSGTFFKKSMYYAFGWYSELTSAPGNLFQNNLDATDFTGCLWGVPSNVANNIEYPIDLERSLEEISDRN